MTRTDPLSDETLMAFADGELDPAEARDVAARIASDPGLAARVAAFRTSRERVRAAFAPVEREAVPPHLVQAILTADEAAAASPAAAMAAARSRFPAPRRWAGPARLAAALLLGVGLGVLGVGLPFGPGDTLDPLAGERDALRVALETASSGAEGPIRLTGSYATEGSPCRSFALAPAGAQTVGGAQGGGVGRVAGLACRDGATWRTRMVVALPTGGDISRPASGEEPLVRELLDRLGAGEPLDAEREAEAIRRAWR